jgi:hypothetical protein
MERGVSVKTKIVQSFAIGVLTLIAQLSSAEDAVVLVTSENSSFEDVSSLDIRKAYLGISVTVDGKVLRPIRRGDDERLDQVFLQSVMAMSRRSYERRLLSLVLKFGTPRPVEIDEREDLVQLLLDRPNSISYMWKSDAESDSRVKTIKILWQET